MQRPRVQAVEHDGRRGEAGPRCVIGGPDAGLFPGVRPLVLERRWDWLQRVFFGERARVGHGAIFVLSGADPFNWQMSKQFTARERIEYRGNDSSRPKSLFPRLDGVTVYALTVERITGKHQVLPATEMQWPAADHTKSPEAIPASSSLGRPAAK